MANKKFWLRMLVMVLVFGMSVVGCDNGTGGGNGGGGGLAGTWGATINGIDVTVVITSTTWTFTAPAMPVLNDNGTFAINGITSTLTRAADGLVIGTAVLLDSNTISLTLNHNTDIPGTYTLTRR